MVTETMEAKQCLVTVKMTGSSDDSDFSDDKAQDTF